MKKILLISGGMDSLVIHRVKQKSIDECIYIDYGQKNKSAEKEKIAKSGIPFTELIIPKLKDTNGFFLARNLKFVMAIVEYYKGQDIVLYFGNTAEDNYPDNTREYLYRVEKIINDSYSNAVRIICPLQDMGKREIYEMATEMGIDYYFCDVGEEKPCKKCHSCITMEEAGIDV